MTAVSSRGALFEETPRSCLAVYAHPDDPDVSCGGTLASWAAKGCEVHVLLCTAGDKGSHDPKDVAKKVVRRRLSEARRATEILGVFELSHLDEPDGEIENDAETRRRLVAAIRSVRPEVVVCPDPTAVFYGTHHFNHRDHRVVGWAALDSVSPAASSPLYFPEEGAPHQVATVLMSGSLEPSCYVDITETLEQKLLAVACHESQLSGTGEWAEEAVRAGATEAGRTVSVAFAEAFRRLELA